MEDAYLKEKVFPVLTPALEELLKTYKIDSNGESQLEQPHEDPVIWLAQYLIRTKEKKHSERNQQDYKQIYQTLKKQNSSTSQVSETANTKE